MNFLLNDISKKFIYYRRYICIKQLIPNRDRCRLLNRLHGHLFFC